MRVRRRVIVQGHVQGVGYRVAVARRAEQRGLAGWVQNRGDGSVEAVFEGESGAVDSLVHFCSEGPRGAVVEHVDVAGEAPEGLSWFDIR